MNNNYKLVAINSKANKIKKMFDFVEQCDILYSSKTENHDERLPEGFCPKAMPLSFYGFTYSSLLFIPFMKTISLENFLSSDE